MIRHGFPVLITCLWVALGAAFFASPAAARGIEGAMPHPMVPLPAEGYVIRDDFTDFAEIEFLASPHPGGRDPEFEETLEVEGAWRQMAYEVDGLELSLLRLYRGYLQHFESSGFEILFSGMGDELSGGNGQTFLNYKSRLMPFGATSGVDMNAYILTRNEAADTVIALSFIARSGRRIMVVNAVEIEDMAPLDLFAPEPQAEPEPDAAAEPEVEVVAEPEAAPEPEMPLVQQAVEELESGLVQDGRVIVNAILFEFDRSDILPESAEALATVAELMEGNADLKLLVVGHTDGVGSFDYNLRLSVDRAQSVVAWLGERHGIDGSRLRPAGAGPMSPVTTNRTEAGRAQNRRVELVEVIE
ncbi:MAG: OmpA family protein [Rhodobacteraceae bacterium]|nr:OmpA family protein [Paracoccaceae bacterium]